MEKTILLTLTYAVGIGELILALYFWATNSKNEIRRVMALLAFSTGMWAITNAFTAYVNPSAWVDWNFKIVFAAGAIIVASLLHFAFIFPHKFAVFDRLHALLLYLPTLILIVIVLGSNTIIDSYFVAIDNPGFIIPGPLFILFEVLISLYYISAIIVLAKKINKLDGLLRKNTVLILNGIILGGLPAIILNLWMAFYGRNFNPLVAVLFSFFWVGFTAYILIRK